MTATVDVAIIGAGPAGIAAARYFMATGLSAVVLEARGRVGGRVVTAMRGGVALDLGAHWLHAGPINPIVAEARRLGLHLKAAPVAGHIRVNRRKGDAAAFDRAFARADVALSRPGAETDCASRMPLLGAWHRPVAAITGLIGGRPLSELSAVDFASAEYADNLFAPGGFGTLITHLARGLDIRLRHQVSAVDHTGRLIRVSGSFGTIMTRALIVTLPPMLLARESIRFTPVLPVGLQRAIAAFRPGLYEHVVLEWPDMPFTGADRIATLTSARLPALGLLTRIDGGPRAYAELGTELMTRERLHGAGRKVDFVRDTLRRELGGNATRRLRVITVTDWQHDPLACCSWSTLPPGAAFARDALPSPLDNRILFAGEATDHAQWGTAGGAWASGARAAEALRRVLSG